MLIFYQALLSSMANRVQNFRSVWKLWDFLALSKLLCSNHSIVVAYLQILYHQFKRPKFSPEYWKIYIENPGDFHVRKNSWGTILDFKLVIKEHSSTLLLYYTYNIKIWRELENPRVFILTWNFAHDWPFGDSKAW